MLKKLFIGRPQHPNRSEDVFQWYIDTTVLSTLMVRHDHLHEVLQDLARLTIIQGQGESNIGQYISFRIPNYLLKKDILAAKIKQGDCAKVLNELIEILDSTVPSTHQIINSKQVRGAVKRLAEMVAGKSDNPTVKERIKAGICRELRRLLREFEPQQLLHLLSGESTQERARGIESIRNAVAAADHTTYLSELAENDTNLFTMWLVENKYPNHHITEATANTISDQPDLVQCHIWLSSLVNELEFYRQEQAMRTIFYINWQIIDRSLTASEQSQSNWIDIKTQLLKCLSDILEMYDEIIEERVKKDIPSYSNNMTISKSELIVLREMLHMNCIHRENYDRVQNLIGDITEHKEGRFTKIWSRLNKISQEIGSLLNN